MEVRYDVVIVRSRDDATPLERGDGSLVFRREGMAKLTRAGCSRDDGEGSVRREGSLGEKLTTKQIDVVGDGKDLSFVVQMLER